MKPKKKAKQLVDKYHLSNDFLEFSMDGDGMSIEQAKVCAIILVDEQIREYDDYDIEYMGDREMYWFMVKEHIEQM